MAEELYDIVFKGELVRSFDLDTVKKNISQLFKLQGPKLEALFTGRSIVLKRNLNFENASKYRVAIKKAGARVDLVEVKDSDEQCTAPTAPSGQLSDSAPGEATATQAEEQQVSASEIERYSMTLAPVGTDVLTGAERPQMEEVDIDVSTISLKAQEGDLLDDSEKRADESLGVMDLGEFDLAPEGEDLLRESERKKVDAISVDIHSLALVEPGERLSEPALAPPDPPDASHLSLEP